MAAAAAAGHVAMMHADKSTNSVDSDTGRPTVRIGRPQLMTMTTSVSHEDMLHWSSARFKCEQLLRSTACEVLLSVLIGFSFLLVIVETDNQDITPRWAVIANAILLVIYTIEASVRIFVQRWKYFCSVMNLLDFFIVMSDLISEMIGLLQLGEIPSLQPLRVFRLLRLTRSVKVMVKFPQLALLVKGLANAMGAVIYGVILLSVLTLFWSICAVYFIHPVNVRVTANGAHGDCGRCERAFESVFQSCLTLSQQVIAGDSWGTVTIPIIEESPVTVVFFAAVFLSINLTLLNVLLAVIVDNALKSSEDDASFVKQKDDERKNAQKRLRDLFSSLDKSNNGHLTMQDVLQGYEGNTEFRALLMKMDIKPQDIGLIFSIMDADGSGTLLCDEFVTELFNLQDRDSHTMLVFIMHYVSQLRKDMVEKRKEHRLDSRRHSFTATDQNSVNISNASVPPAVLEEKRPTEKKNVEKAVPVEASPVGPSQQPPFWEELKNLREVISQDLVCTMREISSKSESHTRLLASIAGDTALLRGGGGDGSPPAVSPLQLPATDAAQAGANRPAPKRPAQQSDEGGILQDCRQWPGQSDKDEVREAQFQGTSSATYVTIEKLAKEPKTRAL